jgi:hypothetical protein
MAMFETKAKTKDTSIKKEKLLTKTFLTASLAKRITFKVYQRFITIIYKIFVTCK